MPEFPPNNKAKYVGPQKPPEVFSFSGEPKGTFDSTHVTGSATEHGISGEKAVDHGTRVRNIVELVGEPVITTDSIRYILDGLRRMEPGVPATDEDLRRFRDHIRENTARLNEKLKEQDGGDDIDVDFGSITEKSPDLSDAAKKQLIPLISLGIPDHFMTFKRRDCTWDVLSRSTRRFTEIFPPIYDNVRITSRRIDSTQKTEQVRELKFVLKHQLSSEITLESLGITSTAGIDSEATHQEIENIVVSSSWTMIIWTVTLDIRIRARRRFDVTERWGWKGEDCPLQSYVPKEETYSLFGNMRTFGYRHTFRDWELRHSVQHADVSDEEITRRAKRDFMEKLHETQGRWMPELPFPDGVQPDFP
jgi:hypothetical protein